MFFINFQIYTIQAYERLLFLSFVIAIIISFEEKFYNIFQLFLFSFFLFNLSRIFLTFLEIGDLSYRNMTLFSQFYILDSDTIELLQVKIYFLCSISLAFICSLFIKEKKERINKVLFENKKNIEKILIFWMIILLMNNILEIRNTYLNGYLSKFIGKSDLLKFFGISINISRALFIIYLHITKDINKNKIIRIYIIINLLGILSGQRGPALVLLLLLTWLYSKRYGMISKKILVLISICSLFMIKIIALYRYRSTESLELSNNFIQEILYSQGISMNLLSYLIIWKNQLVFDDKIYILHYIRAAINPNLGGQTLKRLNESTYLNDHLTFFLSPKIYLDGRGVGTSILAELYDLSNTNQILIVFYTFIFGLITFYIAKRIFRNIYMFIIGYNYLYSFIYSPRDSVGKSLNYIKNDFFLLILLIICLKLFKKILKKNEYNNLIE